MRILQCVGDINPALGGSVEAARQLSIALDRQGHTVELLTLSPPDPSWVDEWRSKVHCAGPALTCYLYTGRLHRWMEEHADDYDAVLVHGVWRYTSVGVWLGLRKRQVPYFVFPHGMLAPYFKQAFGWKHWKKCLCWIVAESRVMRDARAVLFSCEEERRLARLTFRPYRCRELVVGMGIHPPARHPSSYRETFLDAFRALRDRRVVLFLGRLHPIKGCDLLLRAFARVARADPRLHLVMAGPDACGWEATLRRLASQLAIDRRTTWTGPLYGDLKWGALASAEVFGLPSHTENFGISAVEALACGLPVLISNRVNIWREIESDGAGLVAADDLEGAARLLERWLAVSDRQRDQMRQNAQRSFAARFEIGQFASRFVHLLQSA